MQLPYANRREAGRVLAEHMTGYAGRSDLLVLALPRGGVPVAYELAEALEAPLDLVIVRKLGVPGQEELAMGAIASGGAMVINRDVVAAIGISEEGINSVVARERRELERRERAYRGDRPPPRIEGRTVILVDDGLATGSTMLAAVSALRGLRPSQIVVAVPVAPPETCEAFRGEVDAIICAATPRMFRGVGAWYLDFEQTSDEEVHELLEAAWARERAAPAGAPQE
jgi:putative phosphoribosyl transferase